MADKLPWFKCFPTKLLGALAGMPAPEKLVYLIVLLRIYENGTCCPDSVDAIAVRTGLAKRVTANALHTLCACNRLLLIDKGYFNPIANALLEERENQIVAKKLAAEKAARARWEKAQQIQQNGHAGRIPSALQTHAVAMQILDSDLDKEGKKERTPLPPSGGSSARQEPPPKKEPRNRGATLPVDWRPSIGSVALGHRLGLADFEIQDDADRMREWATANSNRQIARKADWNATFDGFLRRRADKKGGLVNGHHRQSGTAGSAARKTFADYALEKTREAHEARSRRTAADLRPNSGPEVPDAGLFPGK